MFRWAQLWLWIFGSSAFRQLGLETPRFPVKNRFSVTLPGWSFLVRYPVSCRWCFGIWGRFSWCVRNQIEICSLPRTFCLLSQNSASGSFSQWNSALNGRQKTLRLNSASKKTRSAIHRINLKVISKRSKRSLIRTSCLPSSSDSPSRFFP